MKLNHGLILILGLMLSPPAPAEMLASAAAAREWRMANEQGVVDQFSALLRLPNVARDKADILANAQHIITLFQDAGLQARLLETCLLYTSPSPRD